MSSHRHRPSVAARCYGLVTSLSRVRDSAYSWADGVRAVRISALEEAAMSTATAPTPNLSTPSRDHNGKVRLLGILVIVAGVIMIVAGVVTWVVVAGQLEDENITVSDDADNFAGQDVNGPFTAYAEANVIEKHALEATGGLTYAELPRTPRCARRR